MSKRRTGRTELSDLVKKYRRYSVVTEIEKNLSNTRKTSYPLQSLYLSPLFDEKNYDLNCYHELEESLLKDGFLTPLIIVRGKDETSFEIINGVKRFLIGKRLGLKEMPAVLADLSKDRKNAYIIENIIEEGDSALVKSECFQKLKEKEGYNEEKLSSVSGLSITQIRNLLRLSSLPQFLKDALISYKLTYGEGRALLNLPLEVQKTLFEEIEKGDTSVREIERKKRIYLGKKRKTTVSLKGTTVVLSFDSKEDAKENYLRICKEFSDN